MGRSPRWFRDLPEACAGPLVKRSKDTGETERKRCKVMGCSQEDFRAWARHYRKRLTHVFIQRPPTHHLRVTLRGDLTDAEIDKLVKAFCRKLGKQCEYYVDILHFTGGRRHDHFAIRYTGGHPRPIDLFKELIDRSFGCVDFDKRVKAWEGEPAALARYLMKDLRRERMWKVELPPEGFTGRLVRRTQKLFDDAPKEEPVVYSTPEDLARAAVDVGDQQGEAEAFDFSAFAVAGAVDATPMPTDAPDVERLTDRESVCPPSTSAEMPGALLSRPPPVCSMNTSTDVEDDGAVSAVDRKGESCPELSSGSDVDSGMLAMVQDLFATCAGKDGSVYKYQIQNYILTKVDGDLLAMVEMLDELMETGLLQRLPAGRFVRHDLLCRAVG